MIPIEPLSAESFAPFGWVLGTAFPAEPGATSFGHPGSDFWHAHDFDPGEGGKTEVLWVSYRSSNPHLRSLEAHWLTEQAIIPLGSGEIVHVVCPGREGRGRLPDLARLRAFRVGGGLGVCMRPGCWHTSLALSGEVTCAMLTRGSTTRDLVAHLRGGSAAQESSIVELAALGGFDLRLKA